MVLCYVYVIFVLFLLPFFSRTLLPGQSFNGQWPQIPASLQLIVWVNKGLGQKRVDLISWTDSIRILLSVVPPSGPKSNAYLSGLK